MSHKIKIKYYARENKNVGTHSFYAQPMPNGTLGFDEACKEAAENTTIEAHTIRAAVLEYMKVIRKNLLKGFNVDMGEDFLTIGPVLKASVKDKKDDQGNVIKPATAAMLRSSSGNSRVGVKVNAAFAFEFANSVEWEKVDPKTGASIDDGEDVVDDPNDPEQGDDTTTTGGSTGGNNNQGGGTNMEP